MGHNQWSKCLRTMRMLETCCTNIQNKKKKKKLNTKFEIIFKPIPFKIFTFFSHWANTDTDYIYIYIYIVLIFGSRLNATIIYYPPWTFRNKGNCFPWILPQNLDFYLKLFNTISSNLLTKTKVSLQQNLTLPKRDLGYKSLFLIQIWQSLILLKLRNKFSKQKLHFSLSK